MSRDVLIVDDSPTMRQVIKRILRIAALDVGDVFEASTGIEALACLAEHDIGVMILDVNMPGMSGIQLLTRMKQCARLDHIPTVLATSDGSAERIEQAAQLGACGYLRKPFQPEQARALLEPLLGVKDDVAADRISKDAEF